jgi:RNA-directed DNA polymerase
MTSKNSIYQLRNLGLPVMECLDDLATETKLSSSLIRYLSYRANFLYKTYPIAKKNGNQRIIAQPSRELKAIQGWILRNILDKLSSSQYSKGFEVGESILDNAFPHLGSNFLLNIDLENFFPSIHASKVYGVFKSIGYSKEICILLTNFCVYRSGLPQGAPTSPKLANLVCWKLDVRIQGYAGPRGIVYTRYADDITLSAQNLKKLEKANYFLQTIIPDEGLKINKEKTKLCGARRQKKVTGLIISDNHVGIGRIRYRKIRSMIHHLFSGNSQDFNHVNGLLSFTYSVDKKTYRKLYIYIDKMQKKYPGSLAINHLNKKILRSENIE